MNVFIETARRENRLPAAFASFGVAPRPWKPTDSVANMAMFWRRVFWSGRNSQLKTLAFFRLVRARSQSDAEAMHTVNDICWTNDPAAWTTVRGATAAPRKRPADLPANLRTVLRMAPQWNTQALLRVFDNERLLASARRHLLPSEAGSYVWLVGPSRSVSGTTMILSGPEMGFSSPQTTHEVHLSGREFDIAGAGLIGIPGLLVGGNGRVAWGTTYGQSHLDDAFVESLNPSNPHEYLYQGQYRPMEMRVETFAVKGRPGSVQQPCYRTIHGPVVGWDLPSNVAVALGAPFFQNEYGTLQAMADFLRARNIREMGRAALQMSHGENWFAVTRDGDIGWWFTGRYPTYPVEVNNRFPLPGTGEYDWTGLVAANDLPHAVNPADGYLLNWNNKPAPGYDCPEAHLYAWAENHRVGNLERVFQERLAAAGGKLALTDFLAMTREIGLLGDGSPRVLLPFLTRAAAATDAQLSPDARAAAAYLALGICTSADWSVGATLYQLWVVELKRLLFPIQTDKKDEATLWSQFINATTLLHALQGSDSSVPLSQDRLEGRPTSQVVLEALEQAVARGRAGRPESMNFWGMRQAWIDLRPLPPLPQCRRGTYLFAAEMTHDPLVYSAVVPGNSGDPQSAHFADQRDLGGWFMFKRLACTRSQLESGK